MKVPVDSTSDLTLTPSAALSQPAAVRTIGAHALPVGCRLGEFQIERVLGEGGFGIVYLALDTQLKRQVALKEYMPGALAARAEDLSVAIRSERDRSTFELGLRSFINEAQILARLDHPALVKVHHFWEQRGTAYMVMPYYLGQTLKQALRSPLPPSGEPWLRGVLEPLLDVLAYLHSQHIYHRDVSPENILLLPDGKPLLLDFGAARTIIGDATQNLTAILKPGYAPVEQYAEAGSSRQGAWTDLYALAAVLYFVVSGKTPTASVIRLMSDDLPSAMSVGQGRYSTALLEGIDACLAVRPEQRPRDVETARRLLMGALMNPADPVANTAIQAAADTADLPTLPPQRASAPAAATNAALSSAPASAAFGLPPARTRWGWAGVAVVLALSLLVGRGFLEKGPPTQADVVQVPPVAAPIVPPQVAPAVPTAAPPAEADRAPPTEAPWMAAAAATAAATAATAAAPPIAPRSPRPDGPAPAAPCAELLQRLSLGEDSAALREKLAQLRCR